MAINDYMEQLLSCNKCYKDFIYGAKEQQFNSEQRGKNYWWYPKFCPEHQAQYEGIDQLRSEMNISIDQFFSKKIPVQKVFTLATNYFSSINHPLLESAPKAKDNEELKIDFLRSITLYNSKDEMLKYL